MDKLSSVLDRMSVTARVFHTGALCGVSSFDDEGSGHQGHVHVLKSGAIRLASHAPDIKVAEPSLVFYPRPTSHQIVTENGSTVELVCAAIELGASRNNPLAHALPEITVIPLSSTQMFEQTVGWLFDEAFSERQGRQSIIDRLSEVLVIQVLRYVVEEKLSSSGLLRGLTHPQISKVIEALHQYPAEDWKLENMAELAAMSRSKFAEVFKQTLEVTPADYLLEWRISLAQSYLSRGLSVDYVANQVGYENSSSFARAFKKKTGFAPSNLVL